MKKAKKEREGIPLAPSYVCSECKEEKPVRSFRASDIPWRYGGLRCRVCQRAYESRTRAETNAREPERHSHRKLVRHAWYLDNYQRCMWLKTKAYAKKRGATAFLSFPEWILLRQRKACHWCQIELEQSITNVDHIVPIIEGGQHTLDNLAMSCANCNAKREWKRKILYGEQHMKLPKESV